MRHLRIRLFNWILSIACWALIVVVWFTDIVPSSVPHWVKWALSWAAIIMSPGFGSLFITDSELDAQHERTKEGIHGAAGSAEKDESEDR